MKSLVNALHLSSLRRSQEASKSGCNMLQTENKCHRFSFRTWLCYTTLIQAKPLFKPTAPASPADSGETSDSSTRKGAKLEDIAFSIFQSQCFNICFRCAIWHIKISGFFLMVMGQEQNAMGNGPNKTTFKPTASASGAMP